MSDFIKVDIDDARFRAKIELALSQLPFATALALTGTGLDVKKDLHAGMSSAFQNVRRFTLNSLSVEKATKANLTARIYVRSPSVERALRPEIFGGQRDRALEKLLDPVLPSGMYAVPGIDAKRGSDGKISLAWVRGILNKLGYGNVKAKTRRRVRATSLSYFVLPQRRGHLAPGIYQKSGRTLLTLIVFTRRPTYSKRIDWFGIAERSVRANFARQFKDAARTAMKTR